MGFIVIYLRIFSLVSLRSRCCRGEGLVMSTLRSSAPEELLWEGRRKKSQVLKR